MFVHIFASQTTYSWTLLNLLEGELDLEDHIFVFGLGRDHPMEYQYSPFMQEHIFYLKNPRNLIQILKLIFKSEWIYIHLLSYDPTLLFWFLNKQLLRKATWIVWGSDIYAFQKQYQSLRTRVYEWLRRQIIPVFPEIAAFVREDFELITSIYGSKARYIPILYPLPVSLKQLNNIVAPARSDDVIVMTGNSGDPTNNHLEIFGLLSHFGNENMKIVCPLAYGGTEEYRQLVISKGISTFGKNFVPWLEMKSKEEYAQQLAGVDIAIMNHKRQQGLGNILALLYLGKKVFLRPDTTSYAFMLRNNCMVYNTQDLKGMTFTDFSASMPKDDTVANVEKILQKEYTAGLWKELIKQHE